MKAKDIQDQGLRQWAIEHQEAELARCKAEKVSPGFVAELWKDYTEGDWGALRELVPLRALAERMEIERAEVEVAIGRRIRRLPKTEKNGIRYDHPYSLGLEVAVLRDMTANAPPAVVEGNAAWDALKAGR